jgi:hypothetical protein
MDAPVRFAGVEQVHKKRLLAITSRRVTDDVTACQSPYACGKLTAEILPYFLLRASVQAPRQPQHEWNRVSDF